MHNLFVNDVEAVHTHLDLRKAYLDFLQSLSLLFELILYFLEVLDFVGNLRSTLDFIILTALKFLDCFLNGIFVKIDEAHVLLEIFELLVDPLFFHLKAIVVSQFDLRSLGFDLVDELLVLVVNLFYISDSSYFHRFKKLVTIFDKFFCFLAVFIQLSYDRLSRFL